MQAIPEQTPDHVDRGAQAWTFEQNFTQKLCAIVGTPMSREVVRILDENPYDYRSLTIDPSSYEDPRQFAEDYLVQQVLRKSNAIPSQVDREAEARSRFLEDEAHNRTTNDRLWAETLPSWWGDYSRHVLTILGPCDRGVLDKVVRACKHGSGATVGVNSEELVASKKYDARPTVTASLLPFLESIWPVSVGVRKVSVRKKVVKGGHFFTVPKDAWAFRGCVKSATWNQWFQQGIKNVIEDRLRIFGVDVGSQERNRFLASVAQERGLVTIDLSSASNLNARVACYLAMAHNQDPSGLKWFKLLDIAREKAVRLAPREDYRELEMFCSMGNAFTFPLECVIFLSVVLSVVGDDRSNIAVFGDDIICPQEHAAEVIRRLEFIGFKVNLSKTFLAGRFFESCGTDWHSGQNVRPFYLRADPSEELVPQSLIAANRLRSWLVQVYGYCPARYRELWQWCVDQIPHPWKIPVSPQLGDTGYHIAFCEREAPSNKTRDILRVSKHVLIDTACYEGVVVRHVKVQPEAIERRTMGVLSSVLAQLEGTVDRPKLPDLDLWAPTGDGEPASLAWRNQHLIRGLRDRKWEWARTLVRENPACLGMEPIRGLMRLPSTIKTLVPCWGDELMWL